MHRHRPDPCEPRRPPDNGEANVRQEPASPPMTLRDCTVRAVRTGALHVEHGLELLARLAGAACRQVGVAQAAADVDLQPVVAGVGERVQQLVLEEGLVMEGYGRGRVSLASLCRAEPVRLRAQRKMSPTCSPSSTA